MGEEHTRARLQQADETSAFDPRNDRSAQDMLLPSWIKQPKAAQKQPEDNKNQTMIKPSWTSRAQDPGAQREKNPQLSGVKPPNTSSGLHGENQDQCTASPDQAQPDHLAGAPDDKTSAIEPACRPDLITPIASEISPEDQKKIKKIVEISKKYSLYIEPGLAQSAFNIINTLSKDGSQFFFENHKEEFKELFRSHLVENRKPPRKREVYEVKIIPIVFLLEEETKDDAYKNYQDDIRNANKIFSAHGVEVEETISPVFFSYNVAMGLMGQDATLSTCGACPKRDEVQDETGEIHVSEDLEEENIIDEPEKTSFEQLQRAISKATNGALVAFWVPNMNCLRGLSVQEGNYVLIDRNAKTTRTLAHELGHALGLGHATGEVYDDNLMNPYDNKGSKTSLDAIQTDHMKLHPNMTAGPKGRNP